MYNNPKKDSIKVFIYKVYNFKNKIQVYKKILCFSEKKENLNINCAENYLNSP